MMSSIEAVISLNNFSTHSNYVLIEAVPGNVFIYYLKTAMKEESSTGLLRAGKRHEGENRYFKLSFTGAKRIFWISP